MSYWNWYFSLVKYQDNIIRIFSSNPLVEKAGISGDDFHVPSEFSAGKKHVPFQSWTSFSSLSPLLSQIVGVSSPCSCVFLCQEPPLFYLRLTVALQNSCKSCQAVPQGPASTSKDCLTRSLSDRGPHTACCPSDPFITHNSKAVSVKQIKQQVSNFLTPGMTLNKVFVSQTHSLDGASGPVLGPSQAQSIIYHQMPPLFNSSLSEAKNIFQGKFILQTLLFYRRVSR